LKEHPHIDEKNHMACSDRGKADSFHEKGACPKGLKGGEYTVPDKGPIGNDPEVLVFEKQAKVAKQVRRGCRRGGSALLPLRAIRRISYDGIEEHDQQESQTRKDLDRLPPPHPVHKEDKRACGRHIPQGPYGKDNAGKGRKAERIEPEGQQFQRSHEVARHADTQEGPAQDPRGQRIGPGEYQSSCNAQERKAGHHGSCADPVKKNRDRDLSQTKGVKEGRGQKAQILCVQA
jgi:hypothetical protein